MTEQEFAAFVSLVQRAGMNTIESAFANRMLLEIREQLVEKPAPEAEEAEE